MMKRTRICLWAALIGAAGFTASAHELIVKKSVRGRSGMKTVVKIERTETAPLTLALSKQGQGLGDEPRDDVRETGDRERRDSRKHHWRNVSRPIVGSAAVKVRD